MAKLTPIQLYKRIRDYKLELTGGFAVATWLLWFYIGLSMICGITECIFKVIRS